MTNLLNNKLVVAGLVLGACAIIYFRVVGPAVEMFFPEKLEAVVLDIEEVEILDMDGSESFSGSTEQELQLANAKYNLTKIDVRHLRWNENPTRNPFTAENSSALLPVSKGEPATAPKNPALPQVSAIVNSRKLKFAVIDGEILREGEIIDGYRLSRIESDNISLTHLLTGYSKKLAVTE